MNKSARTFVLAVDYSPLYIVTIYSSERNAVG